MRQLQPDVHQGFTRYPQSQRPPSELATPTVTSDPSVESLIGDMKILILWSQISLGRRSSPAWDSSATSFKGIVTRR